ncbi:MAG: hypothetical protein ACXVDA_25325, partial [Ktedonobacterales bacterium]
MQRWPDPADQDRTRPQIRQRSAAEHTGESVNGSGAPPYPSSSNAARMTPDAPHPPHSNGFAAQAIPPQWPVEPDDLDVNPPWERESGRIPVPQVHGNPPTPPGPDASSATWRA